MGEFVNPAWLKVLAYAVAFVIAGAQRVAAVQILRRVDELMYKRILVPLENSPYDEAILDHVRKLARAAATRRSC